MASSGEIRLNCGGRHMASSGINELKCKRILVKISLMPYLAQLSLLNHCFTRSVNIC